MTSLVRQSILLSRRNYWRTLRYCSTQPVRVRFAPSPTGQIHLGGLRTALYNYLFAKSHQGKFIVRIEDTDRTRFIPGATETILEMLDWAGLRPDEGPGLGGPHGPYYQSARLNLYQEYANILLRTGHAYKCFCSEKRLGLVRKDATRRGLIPKYDNKCRLLSETEIQTKTEAGVGYTLRFKLENTERPWEDLVHGPVFQNVAKVEGDPIIVKSDGYPTYHLACVIDDHLMEISHVLRGEEWMASTTKHILLHQALGWQPPKYAHLPLLLNSDGTKLSKRQGDITVESMRVRGYYPDAVLNLLTKAGAGFTVSDTLGLGLDELVQAFRLEKLSSSSGRLQLEHLDQINRVHLKKRLLDNQSDCCQNLIKLIGEGGGHYSEMTATERSRFIEQALEWGQGRINKVEDFLQPNFRFLWFAPDVDFDWIRSLPIDQSKVLSLSQTISGLEKSTDFVIGNIADILKEIVRENGYKTASFMKILRMSLCGIKQGPPVAEAMQLLGKSETMKRLNFSRQSVSQS